eukprot:scaffold298_cov247-Pinguiococcus_pyrenoidosus.AAC.39
MKAPPDSEQRQNTERTETKNDKSEGMKERLEQNPNQNGHLAIGFGCRALAASACTLADLLQGFRILGDFGISGFQDFRIPGDHCLGTYEFRSVRILRFSGCLMPGEGSETASWDSLGDSFLWARTNGVHMDPFAMAWRRSRSI